MKPNYGVLDPAFQYVPAAATSVADTWRRFGWSPTTDTERRNRRLPEGTLVVDEVKAVRRPGLAAPRGLTEPSAVANAA